jgi:GT2 family glycosyltransferase
MYVGHLLTVRRAVAQKVGFDTTFDGVQDFEFMLRISETTGRIGHIPKILYHWRKVAGSVAEDIDAKPGLDLLQKKAVDAHLKRLGLPAEAIVHGGHRLRMKPFPKTNPPNISVIIPAKDAPDLIARCLASIYELTTYPRFQVTIVDNGTTDEAALAVMQRYPVQRLEFREVFNFSRANNLGSKHAPDGFLVFLNNDTEVLTPDWLEHLLYYAEQPDVGAAGPLLVYDNRTVQHAGVALGMRGTADHVMRGFPLGVDGYAGSLACAREVSAVTAACMMMSKRRFNEVGGFNEYFATAYQDVDLCLRLRDCGLRIIYTPQSVLVHHESVSRKSYYDMVDRMFLLDRWEAFIEAGDPYYSRHFDLERGDYSVALRR